MKSRGYTLIELMVVVAIVGIIAAIAYPSYQGYIKSTYQAQAVADLKQCALKLEKFYSNDFTYVGGSSVCTAWSPSDGDSSKAKFTLSFPTLTKETYLIKATPVAGSEGECVQLSADGTQSSC
ncbi:MAG TPA: type IV pilin protein [Pseudomonadales bacterium]|nr:type IV pilin protein [Pseudomonadales bacterium]